MSGSAALVYFTGGTKLAFLHTLYVPILFAAFFFGTGGGLVAALISGLVIVGPAMPLDVALHVPQAVTGWIVRTGYFTVIGLLAGAACSLLEAQAREIRRIAFHERISGLPNAAALHESIAAEIEARPSRALALVAIDASDLHEIISTFGPAQRDELLGEVAKRIAERMPSGGTIFHIQTQTFGVLVRDFDADGVTGLARSLVACLHEPFVLDGIPFLVTTAVGAAVYPTHGMDAASLRRACASAMASALATHRPFAVFDSARDAQQRRHFFFMSELRDAIAHDHFELYYQPKIDLRTNRCTGVEALLRWHHPTQGFVSPGQFIPVV